jgi:hypothetical protein
MRIFLYKCKINAADAKSYQVYVVLSKIKLHNFASVALILHMSLKIHILFIPVLPLHGTRDRYLALPPLSALRTELAGKTKNAGLILRRYTVCTKINRHHYPPAPPTRLIRNWRKKRRN